MKTNPIKIVFIIMSFLMFFSCGPDDLDLSVSHKYISWTIIDDSNNEPIYGAITNATVKSVSGLIQERSYNSNKNGETFFYTTWGDTIIYAEISAEGYTSQVFEDGDIPSEVRLTPL